MSARSSARGLALVVELAQVGPQRLAGHREQLVADVGVDRGQELVDRGAPGAGQGSGDRPLAGQAVVDDAPEGGGGIPMSEPWPGAMVASGGSRPSRRRRLARYWAMSPSGGAMTTVEPCMTWSPEKSICSSTSSQHRWFEAWPGVCRARRVKPGPRSSKPSPTARVGVEAVAGAEAEDLGPGARGQAGRPRRVVGVGVGDDDPADAARAQLGERRRDGRRRRGRGRRRPRSSVPTR